MFLFNFVCQAANSINSNVAEVYLTNDLSFPKENISMINVVSTPFSIMVSAGAGYLSSDNPFKVQCWALLVCMLANGYAVLVMI